MNLLEDSLIPFCNKPYGDLLVSVEIWDLCQKIMSSMHIPHHRCNTFGEIVQLLFTIQKVKHLFIIYMTLLK